MNSCGHLRFDLGGYVLGGLDAEDEAVVEEHLGTCGSCRTELDELTATTELLASLRAPTRRAPADLKQRVLASARLHTHPRPWTRVLVAAAVVLAALSGFGAANLLHRPPPADAVVSLQGTDPEGPMGEAGLRQVANGVRVDLELAGLRPANEGYYHAWLHRDERRVSAGTFIGSDEAEAQVQLLCGGQLDGYDRLTVTWHPFGDPTEIVAIDAVLPR